MKTHGSCTPHAQWDHGPLLAGRQVTDLTARHHSKGGEDLGIMCCLGTFSPYTVVGVLAARGTSPFGDDQDDRVMMPIGSFRARVMHTAPGRTDQLIVSATSDQTVNRAKAQIQSILRQRHRLQPGRDDFDVSAALVLQFLRERFETVGPARDENQVETAGCQALRVDGADARGSPRHDRDRLFV